MAAFGTVCRPVQELVAQGWWLYRMDHCASAHPDLDREVAITEDGEVTAGLFPLKGTIWAVPKKLHPSDITHLPTCSRTEVCIMKIPGADKHLRVICSSSLLHERQQVVSDKAKPLVPLGAIAHWWVRYSQMGGCSDGHGFYCERCGDGGNGLQTCSTPGCPRVQHEQCCPTDESLNWDWVCDLSLIHI